jgi:hemolysin activation/secretion protein
MIKHSGIWLTVALSCAACVARAQTRLPPPVQTPPVGSPLPGIEAPPPLAPGGPPPSTNVPPANVAGEQTIAISDVAIIGNTAYSVADLAPQTAGLVGPSVPVQAIENARAAILSRYRGAGYSYATVRARIHDTHLRITVTEPHIVAVKLTQDIGPAGVQVLRFLDHLADGRLLTEADLERFVLLANDIPGVSVRALLDPSVTDPGALTLRAVVTRQAVSGSLSADNRAFRETGPEELLAVADLNSFTSFGERTEVSLYHTFNNTDNFGQASEEFFLGGSGLKLRIYAGDGVSNPSGVLRGIGYQGITRVFGLSLSYPVIRSRRQDLNIAALFDGVESDISYNVLGAASRASFDSLRILRLDAQYRLNDIWLGPAFDAGTQSQLTLSQGLPILGAVPNDGTTLPRLNERVDFTKVSGKIDRTQDLFTPYSYNGLPAHVQVELAAEGQYSRNILPPEEEFYLGGPQFNRGFYYGEVTGDSALTVKIEPQLVTALPTVPRWQVVPQATFYAFYDWGQTWESQKTDLAHTLRSLGTGARTFFGQHLEIDLEGAYRQTRNPTGQTTPGAELKSWAFYWQVVGRF